MRLIYEITLFITPVLQLLKSTISHQQNTYITKIAEKLSLGRRAMQSVITQDEICQTSYIIFNIYTKCPRSLMTVSGYRLREKKKINTCTGKIRFHWFVIKGENMTSKLLNVWSHP